MALTPMMKQYLEIKETCKDAILFFRLGDFYEMFFDDALLVTSELDITLTGKDCGLEERAPMCGVPFHAADTYISRLVAKGYKVAICEQAENPATAKGIVKREIIRTITPGTILDENLLSSRQSNTLCSIYMCGGEIGIAFCEVSTGEMMATFFKEDDAAERLTDEISRNMPVEVIMNTDAFHTKTIRDFLDKNTNALVSPYNDMYFGLEYAKEVVSEKFGHAYNSAEPLVLSPVAALLMYLSQTQQIEPEHIQNIEIYETAQYMDIDARALKNLEILQSQSDKGVKGSLMWCINKTKTTMGERTLKNWLVRPLLNCGAISARLGAVSELYEKLEEREEIRKLLSGVSDIERVMGRIILGTANGRDLLRLRDSANQLPQIKFVLSGFSASLIKKQTENLDCLEDIKSLIDRAINDDAPLTLRDGGIIKEGFNEELDKLRNAKRGGSRLITDMEAEEREKTGIKNLKIKYNKVFGYYIEVSKVNLDKVPDYYTRKQTIVNGERYITPKLKEVENIVLGAEERILNIEYQLFQDIRARIADETERVQKCAKAIGNIDTLCSLAHVASKNGYVCPTVDMSDKIDVTGGRHPVVELMQDTLFVPNDTKLDCGDNRLAIITGPNMAGKSTYMRQVALITILAQMGSFVPAQSCSIGIVDKVFTRIGASDDLSSGQSTFMVEMNEMAHIIKNSTAKSLLILDEIGRGTSTYDGLSIAWSVLEHCAEKIRAKTLFATHYHELTELEDKLAGVKNYSIAVKKKGDDIFFLRKIVRGGADESYGIEVAKLAGVPEGVIKRAKSILAGLESENGEIVIRKGRGEDKACDDYGQMGMMSMAADEICEELSRIDVNTLSPIEALGKLFELSKRAKEIN